MALGARELLLILRAQNQASSSIRRLAGDMRGLGRIQELQLRRNAMAIQQANIMRQRQRALAEQESVTRGRRFIVAQQEGIRLLNQQTDARRRLALTTKELAVAEGEYARRQRLVGKNALTTRRAANTVQRLRDREAAINQQLKMMPSRLQANAERMGQLRMRAGSLASEIAVLNQREAELAKRMRIVNKEISAAKWDKAVFGARSLAHAGRLAQISGLALGAALGYAADFAAKFEERATLVATQTGRVGSGFQTIVKNAEQLRSAILRTMADSTSSMEQLSDAAYDIFSSLTLPAGQKGLTAGTQMLKQFSDAAIAGMTDVETVGDGVIAVLNAFEEFKPTGADVNKILNRMFAAVRFGRVTFAEFAATLGTTAPAARAAGQSLDTMAGTVAFLSRPLGINKAAVGFARLTEILGRKKFVDGLKEVGVRIVDANGKMKQLPDIIEAITKRFPALEKGGVKLVQFFKKMSGTEGTIQARRAFVFLAQQLDQYRTVLGQTTKDNNEFDRSLKAMSQTTAVRWRKALNQIRVLFLEIGATVLPVLIQILEPIQDLVRWFQKLDQETKDQIGRWLAWSAVVLLVGGTLAAIVGTIGAIITTLGRLGILFRSTIAVVILLAAVVKTLTGDFDLLKEAGSRAMDFLTGSWEGFIVGAALATAAVIKMRNSLIGLQIAMSISRGGTAAAAGGGFLPMLIGSGRNAKAGIQLMGQAARQGSRVGSIFRAAAVGVALLPGPVKLAAVALAGFGVAAYFWNRRADEMRREAEALKAEQENLANAINQATRAAQGFQGLGVATGDFKRAKLDIADINDQIQDLRKQLKGASKEERSDIGRQIQRLILDRADAYGVLQEAARKATTALQSFNNFLSAQVGISAQIEAKQSQIRTEQQKIADVQRQIRELGLDPKTHLIPAVYVARIQEANERLRVLRGQLQQLQTGSQEATTKMVASFTTAIRELQRMGQLPKGITQGMIKDVLALQVHLGRVLTRKELKLSFRALLDPKSMAKLPGQIQSFLKRQRRQRLEVEADVKLAREGFTRAEQAFQRQRGVEFDATLNQDKARRNVENFRGWFEANKTLPPFRASVTPSGQSLGVALAQGIQVGMSSVNISKTINVQINAVREGVKDQEGIRSPSERWAREIGAPMGYGIILGMLRAMNNITSEFKRGSKKWRKDIRKQLTEAFGQAVQDAGRNMLDRMREIRDNLRSTFFDGLDELSQLRLEWGLPLQIKDLTKNLKDQTQELRSYAKDWNNLLKRGAPLKLLQQLQEMGPEGVAIVEAMADASPRELRAYIRAWKEAERQLNKISKRQMRQQIKEWRKMGRAIAFGIMAGLRDEEQKLLNFFENLFRKMFRNAVRFNRSRSPSKRYETEGKNIVAGLKRGISSGYGMEVPSPGVRPMRPGWAMGGGGTKIEMNINAHHSESLLTTMERARFRLKNRT